MKIFLLFLLAVVSLSPQSVFSQDYTLGRIAKTEYSDFDIPVYNINAVKDFSADSTGASDASDAIQNAIQEAYDNEGGIVYLPAGEYLIKKRINVLDRVTIRGDWKRPTSSDRSVAGTILKIAFGAGGSAGAIITEDYATIRDLSIYYPDQDLSGTPIKYPYTIEARGKFGTVRNVTLVNSYKGLSYQPQDGASVAFPTVINVYGSPIKTGIIIHNTVATPRVQNLHFNPRYWSKSDLGGAPTTAKIKSTVKNEKGVAISNGDGDGGGTFVGINIEGYYKGLETFDQASPRMFDVNISDCNIGFDFTESKTNGWIITGGNVHATEKAVILRNTDSIHVEFNNVTFNSDQELIDQNGGILGFTNCTFESWSTEKRAIDAQGRAIMVAGCKFPFKASEHIRIGNNIEKGTIYANEVESGIGTIDVSGKKDNLNIVIDNFSEHDFANIDAITYPFTLSQPQVPGSSGASIINVTDSPYNAKGNGTTNDTYAFKQALNDAESLATASNGCIVYVPVGVYLIEGRIVVPTNVELRGVNDGPNASEGTSILAITSNKNNPGGQESIKLRENSGIKGLTIFRPEQTWNSLKNDTTLFKYPFAIEGTDKNWAINIALANIYDGIDFSSGGGHFLDFIYGASLNRVVKIGSNTSEPSVIENFQVKNDGWRNVREIELQAWKDAGFDGPTKDEDVGIDTRGTGIVTEGQGDFRFMSHFVNRTGDYLYKINDSPKVNMYLCGGEGAGSGIEINSNDGDDCDVETVCNSYHLWGTNFSTSMTNEGDKIHFINEKTYGDIDISHEIFGGGAIVLQQEYRNNGNDIILRLNDNAIGVIESGYLKSQSGEYRVRTKGNSQAKICATHTEADKWPFLDKDSLKICVQGVAPTNINGFSNSGGECMLLDDGDPVTGLFSNDSKQLVSTIKVYPNPSDGFISIDLNEYQEGVLRLYSPTGHVFYESEDFSTLQDIELPNSSGVYFVEFTTDLTVERIKLLRL